MRGKSEHEEQEFFSRGQEEDPIRRACERLPFSLNMARGVFISIYW